MGERTSYPPGTFSWLDLSTTDPEGAKSFYEALFGWTHDDLPTGNGTYTMFRMNGKDVGAMFEQGEQERGQGIPPHWNSYVTVDDVEESAARVSDLGGNVLMDAFDVMDVGRMAVVADPSGAIFQLWQPTGHIGTGLVNVPGSLTWNELATTDVAKAKQFYSDLFGWSIHNLDGGAYSIFRVGERSNGGIRQQTDQERGVPPNWLVYFAVDDCQASAAEAGKLGGSTLVPPMHVPLGPEDNQIAVLADPQGAVFALYTGTMDD